ncbi:MAG: hypothetical protein QXP81_11050 [Nitrososphaerota archaeon]
MIYLVRIDTDPKVHRLVKRPTVIMTRDGVVAVIPKKVILCDGCGTPIAEYRGDLKRLSPGYVVVEEDEQNRSWLIEVVCERCRTTYFANYAVRSRLGGDG